MNRLAEEMVCSGLSTAWRLASWPTRRSSVLVNPTTDGVKRLPSLLMITVGFPPSITATTEFVVPRSMPTAFAIPHLTAFVSGLPHRVSQQLGITPPGVGNSYHLIQVETPGCQRRNRATAQAPRMFAFTHRPRFTYSKYRANFSRFGLQGYDVLHRHVIRPPPSHATVRDSTCNDYARPGRPYAPLST